MNFPILAFSSLGLKRKAMGVCRRHFDQAVRDCALMADEESCLREVERLAHFADETGCGGYASPELESLAYRWADVHRVAESSVDDPRDVLIVMSEAYATGGHTRVVERWIELDRSHKYSLVLTRQPSDEAVPERLLMAVRTSGGVVRLMDCKKTRGDRAAELRAMAWRFPAVVLHIHPDDVIPLVAFGTERFPRPVGFYNHADHRFWLGVGMADAIAELREYGQKISRQRRGILASTILSIPADAAKDAFPDCASARCELEIDAVVHLVVSCGPVPKYRPFAGIDFLEAARRIVQGDAHAQIVCIGIPDDAFPAWREEAACSGGRFRILGKMPYPELRKWLAAADVYVDSLPLGGGTTVGDALLAGSPVLSIPSVYGHVDWIMKSKAKCQSIPELAERAVRLLSDMELRKKLRDEELEAFNSDNDPVRFRRRLDGFMKLLVGPHRLHDFQPSFNGFSVLDLWHYEQNSWREDERTWLGGLIRRYAHVDLHRVWRVLEVFGIRIAFPAALRMDEI